MKKQIIIYVTIFLLFSCKKNEPINQEAIKIIPVDRNFSQTTFHFPDTVQMNKIYEGRIYYKSLFDTLNAVIGKNRFITYRYKANNTVLDYTKLVQTKHDSAYIRNDTLYFKIKFSKKGKNYINSYIIDDVYIETRDSIREIEKIIDFNIPVFVKH